MTIQVATYHSINAKPEESWLGYCILPSGQQLLVRFSGATEESVIVKARAFYEKEKARQDRLYGGTAAAADNDELACNPLMDRDEAAARAQAKFRGVQFVGKIWMLNRETGERARVLPAEVADYAAKGYIRGGPRSK